MAEQNGKCSASGDGVGLRAALLDDDAVQHLLQQLTVLAQHAVSAEAVSITVVQAGRYRTANSSGPEALAIDEAQYEEDDGPCLESIRTSGQLTVRVGEDTARWPRLDEEARRNGIRGVLSTPLRPNGGEPVGALNVYSTCQAFGEAEIQTAELIGEQAAILVRYAVALADSKQLNEQLQEAVASRETIGTAKGILMQSETCTRDRAFDILRRASQRENRKLRDVAEELVERVEARARG